MAQKKVEQPEKDLTWYIFLGDAPTNKSVLMHVANACGATEDKLHTDKPCADGERRNLFEIKERHIKLIKKSAREFSFDFEIFLQHGQGLPQRYELNPAGKNLARTQPVRKIAHKLESMKQ